MSYHPPTGAKHASSGDETPPIPEEELEQQKIEHEHQVQKEKERQAREAEEDKQLDIELLHQRAIEAEEEQNRETSEDAVELRGMNTSWSHHRLCDLQRHAARQANSRALISDVTRQYKLPESNASISEGEGISINFSRRCSTNTENPHFGVRSDFVIRNPAEARVLRASENDVRTQKKPLLFRAPSCPGCRAPIASLDCMDEFSANSHQFLEDQAGEVTFSRHLSSYLGNNTSMPSIVPGLRHKNLGKSGLRVPNVGLAMWSVYGPDVPDEVSEEIINISLDNGINLFDLSEAHCAKAETELGRILKKRNLKRSGFIIVLKIYWSTKSDERGLSRKHIIESIKASLARLQLEYIDVVLLHKLDPVCPMEELVRAMKFVINQGWIMYWGTARWTPAEIMEAYNNCRQFNCITPVVEQTEYHMFCREKSELYMPELYHKIGVGLMVWSAITTGKGLANGEMTAIFAKSRFNRKYSTFSWSEDDIAMTEMKSSESKELVTGEEPRTYGDKLNDLSELANIMNCTLGQLAVAWCLKNETVNCLLIGATSIKQLRENIHSLQVVPQLSVGTMIEIERILANKPQRPPMVSTLAMRNNQQQALANATVCIDMTGATTSEGGTPKEEAVEVLGEGEASTPVKDGGRRICEIQ